MKLSRESAALWATANRRNSARLGLPGSDPADALHPVITIPHLIKSIGKNPDALELLAARSHEMTPAQRTAALKAHGAAAPKVKPKVTKAAPPVPRGLSGVSLWGKHGAPRP